MSSTKLKEDKNKLDQLNSNPDEYASDVISDLKSQLNSMTESRSESESSITMYTSIENKIQQWNNNQDQMIQKHKAILNRSIEELEENEVSK